MYVKSILVAQFREVLDWNSRCLTRGRQGTCRCWYLYFLLEACLVFKSAISLKLTYIQIVLNGGWERVDPGRWTWLGPGGGPCPGPLLEREFNHCGQDNLDFAATSGFCEGRQNQKFAFQSHLGWCNIELETFEFLSALIFLTLPVFLFPIWLISLAAYESLNGFGKRCLITTKCLSYHPRTLFLWRNQWMF